MQKQQPRHSVTKVTSNNMLVFFCLYLELENVKKNLWFDHSHYCFFFLLLVINFVKKNEAAYMTMLLYIPMKFCLSFFSCERKSHHPFMSSLVYKIIIVG